MHFPRVGRVSLAAIASQERAFLANDIQWTWKFKAQRDPTMPIA
jgi:hypothetical protein